MPSDPIYKILLTSISFFPPSSSHYASALNELGRYIQSKLTNHTEYNENDHSFSLFMEASKRYQEAIEVFETNRDYVNAAFILCNISRLFCYPFTSSILIHYENKQNKQNKHDDKYDNKQPSQSQQQLKIQWIKQVYEGLRWFNTHCDIVLQSSCDPSLQEGVCFKEFIYVP